MYGNLFRYRMSFLESCQLALGNLLQEVCVTSSAKGEEKGNIKKYAHALSLGRKCFGAKERIRKRNTCPFDYPSLGEASGGRGEEPPFEGMIARRVSFEL